MRLSYRDATLAVCSFNIFLVLLLLRGFFAATPSRPGQPDPGKVDSCEILTASAR